MTVRGLANLALSRLFEPPCAACGTPLIRPLNGAVCDVCWTRIATFTPPLCPSCGLPLSSWRAAALAGGSCPRCRDTTPVLAAQRAIGPYDGTLRAIVHALKYDGRRSVASTLAARMRTCASEVLTGATLAVPVPLHRRRQWRRGFNQADLLASGLGLRVGRVLIRQRPTAPQVTLAAAERHPNVRGAFSLAAGWRTAPADLDGHVIVLVDDVCTTGATLDACARTLKAAGAAEVRAVTAARAVSEPPR